MNTICKFFEEVADKPDICDEIGALTNEDELLAYINEHGCKATKTELDSFINIMIQGGEISDDMAAGVAGGVGNALSRNICRLLADSGIMRTA